MINKKEIKKTISLGRPRDETLDGLILTITRELVNELGYKNVSIQCIADKTGIGRQTIYRRWLSKAELVLDAFLDSAPPEKEILQGDFQENLFQFLSELFDNLEKDGYAIKNLIAAAQEDPIFLEKFRCRFAKPREDIVTNILQTAIDREEIPHNADIHTATIVLHGAFWYRLLLNEPLNQDFAKQLVVLIFNGLKVK